MGSIVCETPVPENGFQNFEVGRTRTLEPKPHFTIREVSEKQSKEKQLRNILTKKTRRT
jgi:hypothetical protein